MKALPQNDHGISVLVCTFNGAKRLEKTLAHLAAQVTSVAVQWEIILVDNNSTDNTSAIAKKIWEQLASHVPFRIVGESRPGKNFALETGIFNAVYNLLLICDDDNWLQQNYVQYAFDFMWHHPQVGVLGGAAIANINADTPAWFPQYEPVFAVGKQLQKTGIANQRNFLFGAGMVIRKVVYDTIDALGHDMLLTCRKGNSLSSGGDSEICLLAMQLGYDLYYDERLQFTHYISTNRLKWSYCVEMMTKGFAHPQIYYAMYEACFASVRNNEAVDFENIYRWNMRKQKRILLHEWKGVPAFFSAVAAMIFSKPGNDKEIRIKTAINKLRYMKAHKNQLSADFNTILQLAKKIAQLKFIPVKQLPLQQN